MTIQKETGEMQTRKDIEQEWGGPREAARITGESEDHWRHRFAGRRGGIPGGVRVAKLGRRKRVNLLDFREWLSSGGDAAPASRKSARGPGRPRKSETLAKIRARAEAQQRPGG